MGKSKANDVSDGVRARWLALWAGSLVAAMLVASACGDSEDSGGDQGAARSSGAGAVPDTEAVQSLPKDIQQWYAGLDEDQPIDRSVYADFEAKDDPPWTIGYASSYAGNTWRAAALSRLQDELIPEYQNAGLVDELLVTQAELDDTRLIQQIRQLVDRGADMMIICCPSTTALNQALKYAYDRGVPTVVFSGYTTSPYSINIGGNFTLGGAEEAQWLAEEIGGAGKVLLVSGIPGASASDGFDNGVKRALQKYPDVEIVGEVAGQWTDQIAKTEVLKWFGTHPEPIDGIIVQSAEETGVLQAMLQSGREVVPITLGGETGAVCYWRQNEDWISNGFHIWPPGDEMQAAFEVGIRTLQGQGPKVESIVREIVPFSYEEVVGAQPEDCDVNGDEWFQPTADDWFSSDLIDQYFDNPEDPLDNAAN